MLKPKLFIKQLFTNVLYEELYRYDILFYFSTKYKYFYVNIIIM